MPKTTQISVGSATPVSITIKSLTPVTSVTVRENRDVSGWPTTVWYYSANPYDSANVAAVAPGEGKTFGTAPGGVNTPYTPGQTIAQIQTKTGTSTFDQIEDP